MFTDYMESPIGLIELQANASGITRLVFTEQPSEQLHATVNSSPLLTKCKQQLAQYFAGKRKHFDLPLAAQGTPFQQTIWQQLTEIPYGSTTTYGKIATAINNPKAMRAVGAANGKNPISIIVPCHRVIGSSGTLTGYAWGLERKQWLLAHERSCKDSY